MPSGATAPWGSSDTLRATARPFSPATGAPSSMMCPAVGLFTRAKALSNVDLPHPLGPTMTLKSPTRMSRSSCSTMVRLP